MKASSKEVPLAGGRVTPGIVRVGDTVRRPTTANSEFVRQLLANLKQNGSDLSPEFLGIDDRGRDILSYLDGEVPDELAYFEDGTLREAAALIRRFHDLTANFTTVSTEVVCHNDLSPCNFVFRDNMPIAIIDFDAAAPGQRLDDLGYAAWLWLNLGESKISVADQQRRLRLFVAAYGDASLRSVLRAMLDRQSRLIDEGRKTGDVPLVAWASACKDWTLQNLDPMDAD